MDSSPGSPHNHPPARVRRLSDYLPLFIVVAIAFVAPLVEQGATGILTGRSWMLSGMGLFLIILSMFKFFDLAGFADGFQMYDLFARRSRPYAYLYPFIEFGLGLGYLARWQLPFVYGATIAVMLFGSIGVIRTLAKGLDLECACMGTALRVPLSTVTLTEDIGMAAMAALMWLT